MEQKRNWSGWLLIAVIIIASGAVLVFSSLADQQPEKPLTAAQTVLPTSPVQPQTASQSGEKRTANASAIGYGGPVLVRLTLDDQNRIEALDVGGVRFQETEGVGSRVKNADFTQKFIGKTPPLELNLDVDAVAGASVSSKAVVEAVNDAAAFLNESVAFDTN